MGAETTIFNYLLAPPSNCFTPSSDFLELLRENISIQVIFILNESAASPQLPGDDDLGGLDKDQIPLFHQLAVAFQHMIIRGMASV